MKKRYEVKYMNDYGTVTDIKENDVSWCNDEIIVFKGDLENCINYLKTQMIDATLKFLDFDDVSAKVNKYILPWGMSIEIVVDNNHNNIYEVYASSYSVHY